VEAVCDRVIIINHGKIVADATIEQLHKMADELGIRKQNIPANMVGIEELFHVLTR
jgi:ABC-type Na+ transport system ATPase subunit NatA